MYLFNLNPFPLLQRAASDEAAVLDCISELFGGFERVVELNIQTVKTSLSDQQALANAALSARSLSEVIDLHSQQLSATVRKSLGYWRHIEDIGMETGNRFFTAMYAHSGGFLKRFEEMTDIAAGRATVPFDQASVHTVEQPAEAEPMAIVDSAGKVLSSGRVRNDFH